jgi:hypothetical protein
MNDCLGTVGEDIDFLQQGGIVMRAL